MHINFNTWEDLLTCYFSPLFALWIFCYAVLLFQDQKCFLLFTFLMQQKNFVTLGKNDFIMILKNIFEYIKYTKKKLHEYSTATLKCYNMK
jgi:hypothetical protein